MATPDVKSRSSPCQRSSACACRCNKESMIWVSFFWSSVLAHSRTGCCSCLWTTMSSTPCFYHACLPQTCIPFPESTHAFGFCSILQQWLLFCGYALIILCLFMCCVNLQVLLQVGFLCVFVGFFKGEMLLGLGFFFKPTVRLFSWA